MSEIQDNPLDLSMNFRGEVQFQEDVGLWRPFVTQATQDTEKDSLLDASEENSNINDEEEPFYIIPHQVNDINGGEKLVDLTSEVVTQATQDEEENSLADASKENRINNDEEESSYIIPHQVNDINGGEKLEDLTSGVITQAEQDADENSLIDDNEESYMIDDTEESSFIIPHQLLNDNNCIIFYEKQVTQPPLLTQAVTVFQRTVGVPNYLDFNPILKCSLCSYSCIREDQLKMHYRAHRGEKLYHCKFCPHASRRRWNLTSHLKHHENFWLYKCSFCSFSSSTASVITHHQKRHFPLN